MNDKVQYAKTQCPCGMELVFEMNKPKRFEKSVSKKTCKACDSQFLMHVEVERKKPFKVDRSRPLSLQELRELQKPFEQKYITRFEIIRLTPQASKRANSLLNRVKETVKEMVSEKDHVQF